MSPADRAYWLRAQRRTAGLSPEVAAAVLRAFAIIRDQLSDAELARYIAAGQIDQLMARALSGPVLDRAFLPVRQTIRRQLAANVRYAARDLPGVGRVNGQLTVSFDILNPRVIDAVRTLDTKVVGTLTSDVRETVRAFVENGLRDGANPRTVARQIRAIVGLAPNQSDAVQNFRGLLEAGDRDALTRKLRDRRFDRTVQSAVAGDRTLTPAQIDGMVEAYQRRMVAYHAETIARTATLDSFKAGQRLSWEDAADQGIVDRGRLQKTWSGVMDDKERPEHVAMQGETVGFDEPFSNGEMTPGESTWNCRCLPRMTLARG